MVGLLIGAAGAVEAVALAMTMHLGVLPPTINQTCPDPDAIWICANNRPR